MSERVAKAARRAMDPLSTRSFALWYSTLGPPLIWGGYLLLGDALYELGCSPGFRERAIYGLSLHVWSLLLTGLSLGAVALAGVLAHGAWRRIKAIDEGDTPRWGRAHAMAVAGMASAFIYGLLILYGFLPAFLLTPCGTSP